MAYGPCCLVYGKETRLSSQCGVDNGATPDDEYENPCVYKIWDADDKMIVGRMLRTITDPSLKSRAFDEMKRIDALPTGHIYAHQTLYSYFYVLTVIKEECLKTDFQSKQNLLKEIEILMASFAPGKETFEKCINLAEITGLILTDEQLRSLWDGRFNPTDDLRKDWKKLQVDNYESRTYVEILQKGNVTHEQSLKKETI